MDNVKLFNDFFVCSCGSKITGQKNPWGDWYRCSNSREKEKSTCNFNQNYFEQDFIDFFNEEIFSYLNIRDFSTDTVETLIYERHKAIKKTIGEEEHRRNEFQVELREYEEGEKKYSEKRVHVLCNKINEKELKIGELTQELETLTGVRMKQKVFWLRKSITHFSKNSREEMRAILLLTIDTIVMGEIHDDNHKYKNNKDSRNADGRPQKIIQSIKLKEPFDQIFLHNRYRNNV